MAPPPYLPQELVDAIIDYVDDDRPSLLSCAQVSRSWLHSSRHHLFATIALSPHSQFKSSPQQLCRGLFQVLQESPAIVPYIRTLQVIDGGPSPNIRAGWWITSERTLPPLLKLLTHLRQFELGASSSAWPLQWKSLPFTLQNAVCTVLKLPSLTFFRLSSWTFPNLVSLAAVISSCQNLKGLSLSSVTVDEELDPHPRHPESLSSSGTQHISIIPPPPPQLPFLASSDHSDLSTLSPTDDTEDDNELEAEASGSHDTANTRVLHKRQQRPHLEALTLDYVNFGYLGYWLFAPSQSPSPINFANLRELRISHSADPLVVEQILLSIGVSLEYLHLKPGSWDVFSFDLRHNPNLKSLRLTLENSETALSWCTTLLSSLSPSGFITSSHSSTLTFDDSNDDLQLSHISLEFWTDLKKLSSTTGGSATSSTASSSLANSPNRSSSSSLILLPSSSPPLSSSPLSSSSLILSPASTSSSSASSSASAASSSTSSSSSSSSSSFFSSSSSSSSSDTRPSTPQRKRSTHQTNPSWSSLDSILSFLPTPLHQVDIGLFAQPTSSEFLRVKESLRGIHARMTSDVGVDEGEVAGGETVMKEREGRIKATSGNVRMYQLGLKSQKSIGRICGPRLRSFEGGNL